MAFWVTHSPRNTEDVGSNPGTGSYMMMISGSDDHLNDGPLSLGSIPSGRLKKLKDVDTWSFLSLCLSVREMSVI